MFIFMRSSLYIGMDNANGGYPHETNNMFQVKVWPSVDEAERYQDKFIHSAARYWQLYEVHSLNTTPVVTTPVVEKKIVSNSHTRALQYVWDSGGLATLDDFIEDHGPDGKPLWTELYLADYVDIDNQGRIFLTGNGVDMLVHKNV
jgi:hypothetical protein